MPRHTHKFGVWSTATAATAPGTIVRELGQTGDPFPVASGTFTLSSSSTEDVSGGDGVSRVRVRGLQEITDHRNPALTRFVELSQEVELNGTTPVTMTDPKTGQDIAGFRGFRMRAVEGRTTGESFSNVGDIDLFHDGTEMMRIPAGVGTSETATLSFGDDVEGTIQSVFASVLQTAGGQPTRVLFKAWIRPFKGPWTVIAAPLAAADGQPFSELVGVTVPRNHDIKIEIFDYDGAAATVSAGFNMSVIQAAPRVL